MHHVMSLATGTPDGPPHAANLFYAADGLALVWISEPDALHSSMLATDPRVSVTIAPDYTDFAAIRGLQIVGKAHKVADREQTRHLGYLEARYPFLRTLAKAPKELRAAYARIAAYRLEPSRIVLIDNSRGFGHKDTLILSE